MTDLVRVEIVMRKITLACESSLHPKFYIFPVIFVSYSGLYCYTFRAFADTYSRLKRLQYPFPQALKSKIAKVLDVADFAAMLELLGDSIHLAESHA
jgi:hypothetical protein